MGPEFVSRLLASTATVALIMLSAHAGAQTPQAPTVAAGSIAVTRQGTTTVVTQGTDKGIIDWRSFSIGPQETVRFDQPGRSSVTLNRVTSSEISRIDGNLSANGQVWISNPNGVMIGPGGQVNVGGLLATTGRIDASEFLKSGRAAIDAIGKDAAIVNSGAITVGEGGYAALAAAAIRNEGVIAAKSGSVALGSGKAVTVDFAGDKLITFQVTQPLDQAPADADALIVSKGTIAAQGGTVLMSARAAKGVMDNVVNLSGHVVSNSVRVDGGTVIFGDGGAVNVSGKIDASSATGNGGTVAVVGEKVGLLDGAAIDASGAGGGGQVSIGGDWQGKGPNQNALVTYVAPTATIKADATQTGQGGTVAVWADDSTRFNGTISAQGGVSGGDGGKVETSGKRALDVGPIASVNAGARAATAKAGSWLLDPSDITVSSTGTGSLSGGIYNPIAVSGSISSATIVAGLATSDVTIQTSSGSGSTGDITVNGTATISYSGATARNLKLLADRDVIISSGAIINLAGAAHSVVLNARAQGAGTGGINMSGAITTAGGSIVLAGGAGATGAATGGGTSPFGIQISGSLTSNGGDITLNGQGVNNWGVYYSGSINSGAGNVSITGSAGSANGNNLQGIFITGGAVTTTNGSISITGTGSTGTGSASHGVYMVGGSVTATGTGSVKVTGTRGGNNTASNILIDGGSMSVTSGTLSFAGTATTGGGGTANTGVTIDAGVTVSATSGAIILTGAGASAGSGLDYGVNFGNGMGPTMKTGAGGTISLDGGTKGVAVLNGTISATSAPILITGDTLSFSGATLYSAGSQSITFQPATTTTTIGLNGGAGSLQINSTVLSSITGSPGLVVIGRSDLTGAINVGAALTLATNMKIVSGGGQITFAGAVDGAKQLQIDAGASTISLGGSIGATTALDKFVTTSAVSLNGDINVGSTNPLTIGGSLTLQGDTTLSTTGVVTISGATNGTTAGAQSLTVSGLNSASLGSVGFNTPLSALTVTGFVPITLSGSSYVTQGTQNYSGAVVLSSSATFNSATAGVSFGNGINGALGTEALTIYTASGTATLTGGVGATTALASLTLSDAVIGGTMRTSGSQSYAGVTAISSATAFSTSNSDIRFGSTLDSSSAFQNLSMTLGTGTLSFGGAMGSINLIATASFVSAAAIYTNGVMRTAGLQSYSSPVILASNTLFQTTNGPIIFLSSVNSATPGAASLSAISVTGTLSASSGIGSTSALSSVNLSSISSVLTGTVSTTGAQSYGTVLLSGATLLSATNSAITIVNAINGASALTLDAGTGAVSFGASSVGATTALTSLSRVGTGLTVLGGVVKTTGSQAYGGGVDTASAATFSTTGGDVRFTGALNGSSTPTFSLGGGTVSLVGGAGGTTALGALTIANVALGGAVITSGAQSFGAARLLSNTTLSTSGAAITLGTVDGAFALSLAPGLGTVSLTGAIGAATALANLNNSSTAAMFVNANVTTSSTQSYAGALLLGASAVTLSSSNAAIRLTGGVQGATAGNGGLTIDAGSGNVNLPNALVGSTTALSSFSKLGSGALNLTGAAGTIMTTGAQSYAGAVFLANGTDGFSSSNANINFSASIDGASAGAAGFNLFSGTGTASFGGALGGAAALSSTTVTSAGGVKLGANITLTGGATLSVVGNTILTGASTVTLASGGGTFAGSVDGSFALTVANGSGSTSFNGAIGGTTPLASFANSGSSTTILSSVTTTGAINIAAPVVISSNAAFSTSNAAITLNGVNATTAGGQSLTIAAGTGTVSVGSLGGTTTLSTITSSGTGAITTTGANFFTTGSQSYAGSVALGVNGSFSTSGGNIAFAGLNGTTAGGQSAFLTASTVSLAGGAGATTNLAALSVTGVAALGGSIRTGASGQSFGNVVLLNSTTLSVSGGAIVLGSVDAATAGVQSLTTSGGTGSVTFTGNVGGTTALSALTTGVAQLSSTVRTFGTQSYAGIVLAANATLSSINANITVGGAIDGANGLTILKGTGTFTGGAAIGGTTALTSIDADAGGLTRLSTSVTTSGSQSYGGAVALTSTTNFTSNGPMIFAGGINSTNLSQSANLNAGSGTVTINGAGAITALSNLQVSSTAALSGVLLSQALQSYSNVILTGNTTLSSSGGNILMGAVNATTAGGQSLTTAAAIAATFTSSVGATNALSAFTNFAANLNGTVITTGTQSYGSVTLGANTTLSSGGSNIMVSGGINGSHALSVVQGAGTLSLGGAVGGITPLTTLDTGSGGFVWLSTNVITTGSQSYAGAVLLGATTSFSTTNSNIGFSGGLNGSTAGGQAANFTTGSGLVSLPFGAGVGTSLQSLTADNASIGSGFVTSGSMSFTNAVLTGGASFTTTNSAVIFGTLNATSAGAQTFSASLGTGTLSLASGAGVTTALGALTLASKAAIGGVISTQGSQSYGAAVVLTSNATFSTAGSNLIFQAAVDSATAGASSLTIVNGVGAVSFGNNYGLSTSLASMTQTGTGTVTLGGTYVTTGAQSFSSPVVLTANSGFATTNADVIFANALNATSAGAQSIAASLGSGKVSLAGGAGGTTALSALSLSGVALGGTISTTGSQSYGSALLLSSATFSISTAANLTFGSLNGSTAGGQTITSALSGGTVTISGGAGGTTALSSLDLGTAALGGAIVTTGTQSYATAVLSSNATFSTTNAGVTFGSLNGASAGAQSLTGATGSGVVSIATGAGGGTALSSISLGAALIGGVVKTSGSQSYVNAVLASNATISITGAGNLTFGVLNASTSGGQTIVSAIGSNTASITGGAGGTTALSSLTLGTASLGGVVTTVGTQSYASAVLNASTVFNTTNASVTFNALNGTGAGVQSLTAATGTAALVLANGAGGTTALNQLNAGVATLGGVIATGGTQSYSGAVTLSANATFSTSGSSLIFQNPIDAATAGGASLTVAAGGAGVTFGNSFGATTALSSFTQIGAGTVSLGGSYTTTGTQSYNGPVLLTNNSGFNTTNSNVVFAGVVNASTAGGQSLAASVGSGQVSLSNGVGGTTALSALSLTSAALGGTFTTTGAQNFGTVVLTGNSSFVTSGADLAIGTLNGASAGGQSFASSLGGGTVTLTGAGATTALGALTVGPASIGFAVKTTGAQSYAGAVTLNNSASFTTSNAALSFLGAINGSSAGAQSLTLAAGTGAVTLGSVGVGTSLQGLTQTGTGTVNLGGNYVTTSSQSFAGSVVIGTNATFSTSGGDLIFTGPLNAQSAGGQAITALVGGGTVTMAGGAGATNPFSSMTLSSAALGGVISTTGTQSFGSAVLLSNTTFSTSNAAVTFGSLDGSTVGGQSLISATGSGVVGIATGAGGATALSSISLGPALIGGVVKTSGSQSYANAVLASNATISITGAANLGFGVLNASTSGGQTLITSIGANTTSITGGAGGTTALSTLNLGTASLGGVVTTVGTQSYASAVLNANATFNTTNAAVSFNALNGASAGGQTFTAATGTAAVVLSSGAGGTTALNTLTATNATLSGVVATSGTQSYSGAVVLSANATVSTTGATVTFQGPIDAASAGGAGLTVSAGAGSVAFNNNFGVATSLASFTQLGGGSVSLGGTYVTTGAQSFTGPVTLVANAAFSTTNANVSFGGAVNAVSAGGQNLSASVGSGVVSLASGVGNVNALSSLTLSNAALGGTLSTTGTQSYGAATLLSNATFSISTGASLSFGTLNGSSAGGQSATSVLAGGTVSLAGGAGGTTALSSLSLGNVALGGAVVTSGTQSYANAVLLSNASFTTTNSGVSFGALNASTAGGQTITAALGTGAVSLAAGAGGTTALSSLTLGTASLGGVVTTVGAQSYANAVLTANAAFNTTNASVTFNTLNGSSAGGQTLTASTGSAALVLSNGAGGTTALGSLTAGSATLNGVVATTGTQSYSGGVVLASNTTISTTGGNVAFQGPIDAASAGGALLFMAAGAGNVTIGNNFGLGTALGAFIKTGAGGISLGGTYVTTGQQTYVGPMTLSANTLFSTTNSALVFSGSVDGASAGGQTLTASVGSGVVTLSGGAGNVNALSSLTLSNAALGGTITTTGAQSYGSATLLSNATFSISTSADLNFGTLNGSSAGSQSATSALNGGTVSLAGGAGGTTSLSALALGNAAIGGAVVTLGAQSYANVVLLSNASFTTTNIPVTFGALNGSTVGGQTITTSLGSGTVSLAGGAGGTTALSSLTLGASALGGTIVTTGAQSYGATVILSDATFSNSNAAVTFGAIDGSSAGGQSITAASGTGGFVMTSGVGVSTALNMLTVGAATLGGVIKTTGTQLYSGGVTLGGNTTISTAGAAVTFQSPIDATGAGAQGLTVSAGAGALTLGNGIGTSTGLASFTQIGTGAVSLGGTLITTGSQNYQGAVTLTSNTTFSTTNAPLIFGGAVNATTAGVESLTASIGSGTVTLAGGAGATNALSGLTVGAAALGGTISTTSAQSYGATVLTSNASFVTTGGDVTFASLEGSSAGGQSFSTSLSGGTTSLLGGAGSTTALSSIAVGPAALGGAINTTGTQSYGGVLLTSNATFSTNNADVTFGALDGVNAGSQSATIATGTGTTSLAGGAGGKNSLASLTVGPAALGGTIITTGAQSYGATLLLSDAALSTGNSAVSFSGAVNANVAGSQGLTLNTGSATASFAGGVGATNALSNLAVGPASLGGVIATMGDQIYSGPVTLTAATNFQASGQTVTFGGTITGPYNLNVTAATAQLAGDVTTSAGAQNYAAAVVLTGDVILSTTNAGVSFSSTVDTATAGSSALSVNAGTGTVSFGGAVGTTNRLKSFATGTGTTAVLSSVYSAGAQSYGGAVLLSADATFATTGGGGNISFAGTVDSAAGGHRSLTLDPTGGGSISLAGALGGATALQNLSIASTGADVALPNATLLGDLSVSNTTGSVTQTGSALNVGGTASFTISGASGDVILNGTGNLISAATFSNSGTGTNQLRTTAGTLTLGASTVGGTLALTSSNSVTQSGALTAASVALLGTGGDFQLTNAANQISVLGTNTGVVNVVDAAAGGLTLGAVGSTTGLSAVTTTLSSAGTLSGALTSTGASNVTLGAQGGTLSATINGQSGGAAAALITLTTGFITVNSVALSTTVAPVATTASVASVPTVASVATIATTVSVATVASVPSVATTATVASLQTIAPTIVPTSASVASVASTPTQVTITLLQTLLGTVPVSDIIAGLIPVPVPVSRALDLFIAAATGNDGEVQNKQQAAQPSAQATQQIVTATPSGALIPLSPAFVANTGAPLIATQTIKVDAADTGGPNGQIVAGPIGSLESTKPVLPGLVSETTGPAVRPTTGAEPPLAQQPSQMNEESLLD